MERDPRPRTEPESRAAGAPPGDPSGRFADAYAAERDELHLRERLEFLSCDPFERSDPPPAEPAR